MAAKGYEAKIQDLDADTQEQFEKIEKLAKKAQTASSTQQGLRLAEIKKTITKIEENNKATEKLMQKWDAS